MVTIKIPSPLRRFTGEEARIIVQAATVGEALDRLVERHQTLRTHLFDADGRLRDFVNLYLNRSDVRTLQKDGTPTRDGDELVIVPSIAGGSHTPSNGDGRRSAVGRPGTPLTQDELFRYSRHLILPEVGMQGQQRLKDGSVLLVGAGGLGSPAALYLAAAGVGRIGIVDFDNVDATNLQRQVLYGEKDVGKKKAYQAKERLEDLNPNVTVEVHDTALTSKNAWDLVGAYDVVADGSDNFPTRYLVNDACVLTGRPNAYGSIYRFEGQASVFGAKGGPCYRCLYANPPPPGLVPSCAEGGVLGVLPGIIGSIQATEAIKLLVGGGDTLAGRLLLVDAWAMEFTTVRVTRDPDCRACGDRPTITELMDYDAFCGVGSGPSAEVPEAYLLGPKELHARLQEASRPLVVDVREPGERAIATIAGSLNVPLQEIGTRLHEIPRDREVVLHCKSGPRAAQAWHRLREAGYEDVKCLKGGILAWQDSVAPHLARY